MNNEIHEYADGVEIMQVSLPEVDPIPREDLASNINTHHPAIVDFAREYNLSYADALHYHSPGNGWDALLETADRLDFVVVPSGNTPLTTMDRAWNGSDAEFAIAVSLMQEAYHQNIAQGLDKSRRARQHRAMAAQIAEYAKDLLTTELRDEVNLSNREQEIIEYAVNVRSLLSTGFNQPTFAMTPELDNDYTQQFPLANAVRQRIPIVGNTYTAGYLDAPPDSNLRPNASGDLPSYKYVTGDATTETKEIGFILELGYNVLRSTSVTLAGIMEVQRMKAWQVEYNLTNDAFQTVLGGAEAYTGLGATPTRKEIIKLLFSRRGGIMLDTVVGTLDAMVDYADIDPTLQGERQYAGTPRRVSWIDRMIADQNATIRTGDEVSALHDSSKEKIGFYDRRYGCDYIVERGGDIQETARDIRARRVDVSNSHNYNFHRRHECAQTAFLATLG